MVAAAAAAGGTLSTPGDELRQAMLHIEQMRNQQQAHRSQVCYSVIMGTLLAASFVVSM